MWLDDVRKPWEHGHIGWTWVKTADEAIAALRTGRVTEASLDHDLGLPSCRACRAACLGPEEYGKVLELGCQHGEKTGYDVVCWLEQHPEFYPPQGVSVHSMNPAGAARMIQVLNRIRATRKLQGK